MWASQGLMYYERHILNSAGTLLVILTCAAIQVVCCYYAYMLTPCVEYLWYCMLNCLKQDQVIECTTKGQLWR